MTTELITAYVTIVSKSWVAEVWLARTETLVKKRPHISRFLKFRILIYSSHMLIVGDNIISWYFASGSGRNPPHRRPSAPVYLHCVFHRKQNGENHRFCNNRSNAMEWIFRYSSEFAESPWKPFVIWGGLCFLLYQLLWHLVHSSEIGAAASQVMKSWEQEESLSTGK
jgi:hypothetical protein